FVVVLGEIAVDGGLKVDDRAEHATLEPSLGEGGKKFSTALSQEQEVGVKCKVQRGWRASQARTFGCLWGAELSSLAWLRVPAGTARSIALRKRMSSSCRCRCMQRPMTVPSRTFSAANSVVVPCRL